MISKQATANHEEWLALRHKYHFYITDIKRRNVFYIDAIYTY